MKRCIPFFAALASLAAFADFTRAAPPKVDYLFPAGGQRGTTVEVTVSGTFERWPVKGYADRTGIEITTGKTSGKLSIAIAKDAEPGVYYLRLADADGASALKPFIVGTLADILEKEPNDDPRKPHALDTSAVVVNGRLDKPGDVDTFAVKLTKGQTLVASLEANQTLRSPMDGVIQVLSSDGFVLEQNDDYRGFDPQIAFVVPKDGLYLVRVFAFPAKADTAVRFAGKETFIYRLTLTTGPFVEHTYPLAVSRDQPADVELVGWNLPAELRRMKITPQLDTDILLVSDARIANPFSIQLVRNPSIVKTQATRANPQKITLPATITGRLDRPGDIDVFEFAAKKGDKLAITVGSRTLGFPLDPVLRLTDLAGKTLLQSKAVKIGDDPILNYAVTLDAVYRVEIGDLHDHAGPRYVYRLRVGTPVPDFDVKVTGDNFTLAAGKSLEIPVAVTRIAGFKGEVTLRVEGLPTTIKAISSGKGLTLQSSDKTPFAGPIRVIGATPDGTTRVGQAAVLDLGRATTSLWLTVNAK